MVSNQNGQVMSLKLSIPKNDQFPSLSKPVSIPTNGNGKDVARFLPVNDAILVKGRYPVQQLPGVPPHQLLRKPPLLTATKLLQTALFAVLHEEQ